MLYGLWIKAILHRKLGRIVWDFLAPLRDVAFRKCSINHGLAGIKRTLLLTLSSALLQVQHKRRRRKEQRSIN
jgi:hypothetical protein